MDNIINNYPITEHLEVLVCDDNGKRFFVLLNTADAWEEIISEDVAAAMCLTPDSKITHENWEDFCTARGVFTEDN
jgi:hypothetical protein